MDVNKGANEDDTFCDEKGRDAEAIREKAPFHISALNRCAEEAREATKHETEIIKYGGQP